MLVDTGAQVSLVTNKIIRNKELINPENKITISSIHGSEDTLGDISATIHENNTKIPIKLQVIKNTFLNEDGILGYDIIGEKAIIHGPRNNITLNSKDSVLKFPFKTNYRISTINSSDMNLEIQQLNKIEYISDNEMNTQYQVNLQTVRYITHQINHSKIKITPIK